MKAIETKPGDSEVFKRYGFEMETVYMKVPRCEHCKWWDGMPGYGGTCRLGDWSGESAPLWATDIDGYRAPISTAHDFGCVEWQPRGVK